MPRVRGTGMWASVQAPNTTFEPVYSIDLVVTEEIDKALKGLGLKGKKTDDGIVYKFKRKQFRKDGTENDKPNVIDAEGNEFKGLIGNGSEVIVKFSTYEWKNNFGSGIGSDLKEVQIVNLIPYGDDDTMIGEEEAPAPAKPAPVEFDDDLPDVL